MYTSATYARTTRTHTHRHTTRIGSCPKSNDPRTFFLRPRSAPPYALRPLLVLLLFRMYLPPPTNQNKQTRHSKAQDSRQTGRRAGRQEVHLACLLFFSYIFFLRRITTTRARRQLFFFFSIMHPYCYFFSNFGLLGVRARGRVPTPQSSSEGR